MEIYGGDDTNEEIINIWSQWDALAASLILQQYVADLNDPCTWKLEAILAGFGCQVHAAGIVRLEANFNNILFHLVIVVFTQYIVIWNIIQCSWPKKWPWDMLCQNPYFLVSTDRYGLRQMTVVFVVIKSLWLDYNSQAAEWSKSLSSIIASYPSCKQI